MSVSIEALAKKVGGKIVGNYKGNVTGASSITSAGEGQIAYFLGGRDSGEAVLDGSLSANVLLNTKASVVVLDEKSSKFVSKATFLVVKNPKLAFSKIAMEFLPKIRHDVGVHPSAYVGSGCDIDESVSVGPNVFIGDNVSIGPSTIIEACCSICDGADIGSDCHLHSGVIIYDSVKIGDRVTVHSGTVVGSEGFGFVLDEKRSWNRMPHLGSVKVGDDVCVGANVAIDRGVFDDTAIGNGVIIDNLVHVGHNAVIGNKAAIAGCVGISGSTKIGDSCMIGGGSGIGGHLDIANSTIVMPMGMITKSIKKPGIYASGTSFMEFKQWKISVAVFKKLGGLVKRILVLEKFFKGSHENVQ